MPITRSLAWVAPIALVAAFLISAVCRSDAAAPDPNPSEARSAAGLEVEAKCIDDHRAQGAVRL